MRTGFPSDPLGLPHAHGGTSTRQGMRSSLRSLPHTHGGALKRLLEKEDSPPLGETVDFPLSFHCVRLFLTQIGPPHGVSGTGGFGFSSLHACGKPYYSLSSRVLRTLFPTPVWETGCRGKKRKTQYCLPYTRRGNQLWQPVCPFLRFLPYTYGEAPTLMTRPSPAMSSSLRVTGESLRRPATPEPEAGLPYMYGGVPAVAAGNMLMEQSSLHVRGSSLSRPVPPCS